MFDFDEFLYKMRDEDVKVFGSNFVYASKSLPHGEWVTMARYEKDPSNGDGLTVEIDCMTMPARCYRLRAIDGVDSVGEAKKGFTLSTGSGREMAELMASLAKATAEGMIGAHE
jgi:hypothetical protein